MNLACRNASESSGEDVDTAPSFIFKKAISAAPAVDTSGLVLTDDGQPMSAAAAAAQVAANIGTRTLQYNPTVDELQGVQGGANAEATAEALRNHRSGFVEDMAVPGAVFDMQYNDFNSKGVAEAPNGTMFGDVAAGKPHHCQVITFPNRNHVRDFGLRPLVWIGGSPYGLSCVPARVSASSHMMSV